MLTSTVEPSTAARTRPSYSTFPVSVVRLQRRSESFVRVTFGGGSLRDFGTTGLDQRIKVILPLPGIGVSAFPDGIDWYASWRALPEQLRNPIRTYTVRAVRPEAAEIDVDFVLHGDGGPASRWVAGAAVGDELAIVGPHVEAEDPLSGVEWRPGDARTVLLAGDETAAPAVCSILAALPRETRGSAFIEVPCAADIEVTDAPAGVTVTWLPRTHTRRAHGVALSDAVREWTALHLAGRAAAGSVSAVSATEQNDEDDIDIDHGILWEVPQQRSTDDGLYAWLAGEAGAIKSLRRFLVSESGIDRRRVAFMGYWRAGRAELN
ncbi:siderophore-interacting protein [Leifsonia sp. Root112D2]|uniref:siderophore-interacting protein n=1 Tax=Leifsonia sp. Root112D2 TaxID=1736426 RepID=UPI0006F7581C|nr:siderophore-interacting protein [Leifsonia sp. Root112D2]KQV07877.1 hypothetical protein ASC63_11905 [Leifsonia sp. Root112D2]